MDGCIFKMVTSSCFTFIKRWFNWDCVDDDIAFVKEAYLLGHKSQMENCFRSCSRKHLLTSGSLAHRPQRSNGGRNRFESSILIGREPLGNERVFFI